MVCAVCDVADDIGVILVTILNPLEVVAGSGNVGVVDAISGV